MKVRKSVSVKFKIWAYFLLFAAIIVLLLVLFAFIFSNIRYDEMRKSTLMEYGAEVADLYRQNDFDELQKVPFKYGVEFYVFKVAGDSGQAEVLAASVEGENITVNLSELDGFFAVMKQSDGNATAYLTENKKLWVFGEEISNEGGEMVYVYVTSTVLTMNQVERVLTEHFLVFTLVTVTFASLLALICSMRITEPILSLSETAREVSLGRLSTNFHSKGYSEIEDLTEKLNLATHELKQTEMIRKDFIANVSHDLRTPLTMMKAYAEMIRDISGDDPTARYEHTQIIIDETDRLSVLVNDILQLSRMQSGSIQIKKEVINLSELVEKSVTNFRVLEATKKYVFETDIRKELLIRADAKRVEQVVYNLIANAVNYTGHDKKVLVEVGVKEGKALFKVKDTGKGIEPEMIDNIWEKYYRLNRHYAIKGSGLGLSIVKAVLDEHEFHYGVDSVPNHGTTFWFYAPLVKREKEKKYFKALKDPYTDD